MVYSNELRSTHSLKSFLKNGSQNLLLVLQPLLRLPHPVAWLHSRRTVRYSYLQWNYIGDCSTLPF